jgi:hypothetical protein
MSEHKILEIGTITLKWSSWVRWLPLVARLGRSA